MTRRANPAPRANTGAPASPPPPPPVDSPPSGAIPSLLAGTDVLVCCGSGGVGKTTTAAALGLEAARQGRRAVVVTIDPAKRLADALGVPGGLGNDPVRIPLEPGGSGSTGSTTTAASTGTGSTGTATTTGELWALMLDTASTFDGLVQANAATPEQAERIIANRFYRNIAGSLSGTQEYMAAERLHALHADPRFDLVIVDTPPTRNALDFLDAPGTLARFLDHPLFRLMMMPTRRGLKVLNLATQPVLRTIGKVVGGDVVADAIAFFQAFAGMETGFRRRADEVITLLHGDRTRYLLVASPREDTIEEARFFARRLGEKALPVAAVVVNRCTPDFGPASGKRPRAAAAAALHDNLAELHATATTERHHAAALLTDHAVPPGTPTVFVPTLPTDVHTLAALEAVRGFLHDGATR